MQGIKYFLVVIVGVIGLSLAARYVYSNNPMNGAAPVVVAVAESGLAPTPVASAPRDSSARAAVDQPAAMRASSRAVTPSAQARVQRRSGSRPSAPPPPDASAGTPAPVAPEPASLAPVTASQPAVQPPAAVWQATPRQLVRDSAFVMASSGRLQAAISVLDVWIRQNPTDSAIGLDLARLRARAGDWTGSIAQYTALLEQHRTAPLLFERGQTYLWSGDARRGEADLLASEAMSPRAETERQLGDHYRWQGDLARSAQWYRLALRKAPGDTSVRESLHLLDRAIDARLMVPGELSGGDLGSGAQVISDNAGFALYALRLGQAVRLPAASPVVVTISGELRSATSGSLGTSHMDAWGADVSIASRLGVSKVTASLGVLDHADAQSIVRGSLSADGFVGNARVKASVRRAPAYETLWAPRMLGAAQAPSTTIASQGSLSLPFGRKAEVYAMGEWLSVSDDNTRSALQLALRQRLAGPFSLLYAGSLMAYDRQTPLYYSPARYQSQSLGIELARYREQGVSFAIRAVPGYAWMREPAGTPDSATRDLSAFQFTSGLELGYRRGPWDLLLSTGLSTGREGGYRSQNALLFLRRAW